MIPDDKQEHILWRYHEHNLAEHPGWKETYRAITQRFYWKTVREPKRRYVTVFHTGTKPLNNKIDVPLRMHAKAYSTIGWVLTLAVRVIK